ncbi:serine protease AprX [Microdochium nivale]|nr:serine protease AprX [Microdochium nivale]
MAETVEDRWHRTFDEAVRALGAKGVPPIRSAGNQGGVGNAKKDHVRIGDCVPGCLVEYRSSMTPLCVGAVDGSSSRIWSCTSRGGSRIDGRLGDDARVFMSAPGTDITCVGYAGVVSEGCEGTSYAAAAVAGLIAYILAHPWSRKDPELQ